MWPHLWMVNHALTLPIYHSMIPTLIHPLLLMIVLYYYHAWHPLVSERVWHVPLIWSWVAIMMVHVIGSGGDQSVTVSSNRQFSPAAKLLSYSPPSITQLIGCTTTSVGSTSVNGCKRTGGIDRLTIMYVCVCVRYHSFYTNTHSHLYIWLSIHDPLHSTPLRVNHV